MIRSRVVPLALTLAAVVAGAACADKYEAVCKLSVTDGGTVIASDSMYAGSDNTCDSEISLDSVVIDTTLVQRDSVIIDTTYYVSVSADR